jgi:hypothetical protein
MIQTLLVSSIADDASESSDGKNLVPVRAGESTRSVGIRQAIGENPEVTFWAYHANKRLLARITPGGSYTWHFPYGEPVPAGKIVGYVSIAVGKGHFKVEDLNTSHQYHGSRPVGFEERKGLQ